jgi:coenzyme Q-binding protein COQ10
LRHAVTRVLPYAPDDLFRLVGDVMSYPAFVPWITSMRTWNARDLGDGVDSVDAEAGIRFSFLTERFATRVRRDASARTVDVNLISGPFRKLLNCWRFIPEGEGTRVEFEIDFQFKSRILEGLLTTNFHHAVDRLMTCFEDRARALHGG